MLSRASLCSVLFVALSACAEGPSFEPGRAADTAQPAGSGLGEEESGSFVPSEPATDPCDPDYVFFLEQPMPVGDPISALKALSFAVPDFLFHDRMIGALSLEMSQILEEEAALGVVSDPDCFPTTEGDAQVFEGPCETQLGSSFSGRLVSRGLGNFSAESFVYQSERLPLDYALDGVLTVGPVGEDFSISMNVTASVDSAEASYTARQEVCMEGGGDGGRIHGRVNLARWEGIDGDFLVEFAEELADDGTRDKTATFTGASTLVFTLDVDAPGECWMVTQDGVRLPDICA